MKYILRGFCVVALALNSGPVRSAGPPPALELMLVADEQRMLSQRMAMAACLVMARVDPVTNSAIAMHSAAAFDEAVAAPAIAGDDGMAETRRNLHEYWAVLGPAVRQVAASDYHSIAVAQLLRLNGPLLEGTEATVSALTAAAPAQNRALATTIAQAGRLRMMSQKMSKDACLVTVGIDVANSRASLIDTLEAFEAALVALEEGDPSGNVLAPPNMAAEDQIWTLRGEWDAISDTLLRIGEGEDLRSEDLALVTQAAGQLLFECDAMVQAYLGN